MSLKLKEAFDPDSHKEDAIERAAKSYEADKKKKQLQKRQTEEAFGKTAEEEDKEL